MIKLKSLLERVSKPTDDKKVETKPSESQIEAGNYKKGHLRRDGFDITIENKKGSTRSGVDNKGNKWSVKMNNDYGYIKGTVGKDKDHLDCFLNPDYKEGLAVYIVNQTSGNKFDEHKIMMGFKNKSDAKKAYISNYNRGEAHFSDIVKMDMPDFKEWVKKKSLTKKPAKLKENVNNNDNDIYDSILNATVGDIFPESTVYQYVQKLHHIYDDFIDGDLSDRIEEYPYYILKSIPIKDIDIDEFYIDDDMVDEYIHMFERNKKYPPIVISKYGNNYSIIDGSHRSNALSKIGEKNILSLIGIKRDKT